MKYTLGDKFIVKNIECEVKYINNGKAWVFPLEDLDFNGKRYLACACFEVLDEKGIDSTGNKALVLHNKECKSV